MFERMLIDRMENRILVGASMFVGILILVGWIAINENPRMASFERQYEARAIERGGELFAQNCATCHGTDARGGVKAPALNSPHLFGYDYFAEIDRSAKALDDEETALNTELADLQDEFLAEGTTEERLEEIDARIVEINDRLLNGIPADREPLGEQRNALIAQLQPAVLAGYPIRSDFDDEENPITVIESSRLEQLAWGSTLHNFIFTTLVHGRPPSVGYWPDPMSPWSTAGGGPLRNDQLEDITTYILNFDKGDDWTIEDALAVNQYGIVPVAPGVGGGELSPPVGDNVEAILARFDEDEIEGDATHGEAIYNNLQPSGRNSLLGCGGCHLGGLVAPATEETWDNILNIRLNEPQFAGYTPEQYIVESIVAPGAYIVPTYSDGQMPADFAQRMSTQDLADIIAYLKSFSEDSGD